MSGHTPGTLTEPLYPTGCSWFGYETETQCLHGIWTHKLESFLDFLVANRFNAIRVPFTAELALDLDAAQPAQFAINFTENGILKVIPELKGCAKI
jgi:aryl-phospho-beta-D-glucosidase BglC (GH1 family)